MNHLLEQLKLRLITRPHHLLKWAFSLEKKVLLAKGRISDHSDQASVFVFSVHKCASTFLNQLIHDLSSRAGSPHIDLETCLAMDPAKRDSLYADEGFTGRLLQSKGYFFGVFRYPFSALPPAGASRIVLVLRDPRDVLTSQFFSIAYSHPVYTARFIEKRRHALKVGIDRHVLEMSDRFLRTYNGYLRSYIGRRDVLLIRYEDLIGSFPETLSAMLDFIAYPQKEEALKHWKQNDPFGAVPEDAHRHKRKMLPGDHKEKLKAETISELNAKYAGILSALGYE